MVRFLDGWHEVKVGESHALGEVEEGDPPGRRRRVIEPQYCALRGAPEELGRQLQALSLSQGLRAAPASEFISDGGGWMGGLASDALSWSRWTLDYYHGSGQVAAALSALHGEGSKKTRGEHRRLRRKLLKHGGNAAVRRSLHAKERRAKLEAKSRHVVRNVIGYLKRHETRMDYAQLKAMGWITRSLKRWDGPSAAA